jgi:hypothetical protein
LLDIVLYISVTYRSFVPGNNQFLVLALWCIFLGLCSNIGSFSFANSLDGIVNFKVGNIYTKVFFIRRDQIAFNNVGENRCIRKVDFAVCSNLDPLLVVYPGSLDPSIVKPTTSRSVSGFVKVFAILKQERE